MLEQVRCLVERAECSLIVLRARPGDEESGRLIEASHTDGCEAEWVEFLADCDKYSAEIAKEIGKEKFTLAALGEEEQSLDRLRPRPRARAPAARTCGARVG